MYIMKYKFFHLNSYLRVHCYEKDTPTWIAYQLCVSYQDFWALTGEKSLSKWKNIMTVTLLHSNSAETSNESQGDILQTSLWSLHYLFPYQHECFSQGVCHFWHGVSLAVQMLCQKVGPRDLPFHFNMSIYLWRLINNPKKSWRGKELFFPFLPLSPIT